MSSNSNGLETNDLSALRIPTDGISERFELAAIMRRLDQIEAALTLQREAHTYIAQKTQRRPHSLRWPLIALAFGAVCFSLGRFVGL